jgi:predicted RNA binding protein YcfA (HicA-like mRNA interferase family)
MKVRELLARLATQGWVPQPVRGPARGPAKGRCAQWMGPVRRQVVTLVGEPDQDVPKACVYGIFKHSEIGWKE